jgi:anti-sigma B factor antagonist
MDIAFDRNGQVTVVALSGADELTAQNADAFSDRLETHFAEVRRPHVLVDLTGVRFLSSAGLSALIRVNHVVRKNKGSLRVAGTCQEVRKVFEVTHLDGLFQTTDDAGEAAEAFNRDLASGRLH